MFLLSVVLSQYTSVTEDTCIRIAVLHTARNKFYLLLLQHDYVTFVTLRHLNAQHIFLTVISLCVWCTRTPTSLAIVFYTIFSCVDVLGIAIDFRSLTLHCIFLVWCAFCHALLQKMMMMMMMMMVGSCYRKSVCRLSVTFMRPTQHVEIFGNVSTPFCT